MQSIKYARKQPQLMKEKQVHWEYLATQAKTLDEKQREYLLRRLKFRHPSSRGMSGHRLYLAAYIIAAKFMWDESYTNKSWKVIARNVFPLSEINEMELEMCRYLGWKIKIDSIPYLRFADDFRAFATRLLESIEPKITPQCSTSWQCISHKLSTALFLTFTPAATLPHPSLNAASSHPAQW